jgi:hypothetical protein
MVIAMYGGLRVVRIQEANARHKLRIDVVLDQIKSGGGVDRDTEGSDDPGDRKPERL